MQTESMTNNGNSSEAPDRVRQSTSNRVNAQIDREMAGRIRDYASQSPTDLSDRISELEREWDTERVLEANASVLAFTGLMLGIFVDRNWLWLPAIVLPFLFEHAVQGWCPPIFIIRRLGVRTRSEIDREKYALQALRGDFESISAPSEADANTRANQTLRVLGLG